MFIGNISNVEGNNSSSHHFGHFVANSEGGIFSGKGLLNSALALFLVQVTNLKFKIYKKCPRQLSLSASLG